jgi:hypothetical protein
MDVSGLEIGRKSSIRKRLAYLAGLAITGAVMAVLGAPNSASHDDPDTDTALEARVRALELNSARDHESLQSIKEDTRYLRDRFDHLLLQPQSRNKDKGY